MISIINRKGDDLAALCRKYQVRKLELFGSAATGEFVTGKSDLDFLVDFIRTPEINAFDQYFGLREELATLFGCEIDLVERGAMQNPYFIRRVNESRTGVYAA